MHQTSYLIKFISIIVSLLLITNSCKKESSIPDVIVPASEIRDLDGNIYHAVAIGNQTWMVENLKTTKYSDGKPIPCITNDSLWSELETPSYRDYDNSTDLSSTYGRLYNWAAVNTGKLAPDGWRIPTEADWDILISYLGGGEVAGGKLKEHGYSHWLDPNIGATNESSFNGLPGGNFASGNMFIGLGISAYYWSSSEFLSTNAWSYSLYFNSIRVTKKAYNKQVAFSVRCIKSNTSSIIH